MQPGLVVDLGRRGRLDLVVGALFLLGSAYYLQRVVLGAVETSLPGTGGVLAG